jgi:hypothetical protein
VSSSARVLYLMRDDRPMPEVLRRATTALHQLPAGGTPDEATRNFLPQVIVINGPFDHDARQAVEQVSSLDCPTIGIGTGEVDFLKVVASPYISTADMQAIIELTTALHTCQNPVGDGTDNAELPEHTGEDVVRMLEHLMGLRIPGYQERAARIFEMCAWIGNHLCLAPPDLRELLGAARLREIGKLGLPDTLLFSSRDRRTSEQQALYDTYAANGAAVLADFKLLRGAGRLIGYMLENFDGSGNQRLMSHQIPLGSRILRIAGAYEIVRNEMGVTATAQRIVERLNRDSGSLYDPLIVRLMTDYAEISVAARSGSQTCPVRIADLKPGMVLAQDMWSRTGMKIIAKGTTLSEHTLKVLFHHPLDPSMSSVDIVQRGD